MIFCGYALVGGQMSRQPKAAYCEMQFFFYATQIGGGHKIVHRGYTRITGKIIDILHTPTFCLLFGEGDMSAAIFLGVTPSIVVLRFLPAVFGVANGVFL